MQRQKLSSNEFLDVLEAASRWDLDNAQLAMKCFEGLKDRLTQKRVFSSVVIMPRGHKWPPYLPDDDCSVVITWQKDADRKGELRRNDALALFIKPSSTACLASSDLGGLPVYMRLDDFAGEHYKELKSRPRKRMLGTGEWIYKRCREIDEEEE
ncbi:hypothetical protein AAVH_43077 [Aphelenchoides avenae]|nr:hypothetical protein AAVH_43077 [Aphelenchus avenae]